MCIDPLAHDTNRVEILEGLIRHPSRLSPALRYVQHCIRTWDAPQAWLEEQAHYLLYLLLVMQGHRNHQLQRIDCVRSSTRAELFRRVSLAADWIDSNYAQDFGLSEIAQVACLSKFHLLRLFKQIHGVTPQSFKEQRRVLAARRLMSTTKLTQVEVAERVGYASRASLRAQMTRWDTERLLARSRQ
jgi:AraC family transcriptional regulator